MVRSEIPRRGASPRRSARCASPGGPRSRASRMVKLAPDTARVWVRSVSRNARSSSGVTREMSPTTSPGSSARASSGRSSVASRSPARSRPASRCGAEGPPTAWGASRPFTRSTAANRSPPSRAGASPASTRSRVEGSRDSQGEPWWPAAGAAGFRSPVPTISRTGVRVLRAAAPVRSTRRASASISTDTGAMRLPLTRGRVSRGSAVTSTSATTRAYSRASSGTGPRRTSAPCRPAEPAAAATQSRVAATAWPVTRVRSVTRRRARSGRPRVDSRTAATVTEATTVVTAQPGGACSVTAAVAQAARAGGTSRRSVGPSCRGREASARSAGASRSTRRRALMAVRGRAGRRSGGRRCR